MPPISLCINVFRIDMAYFIIGEVEQTLEVDRDAEGLQKILVLSLDSLFELIRLVFTTFFFVTVVSRYLAFILLLDTYRVHIYDYCVTLLDIVDMSPSMTHVLFCQLKICHRVLSEFYYPFTFIFMAFNQICVVFFCWAGMISFGRVPFVLWLMFPALVVDAACGTFLYVDITTVTHTLSSRLVNRKQRLCRMLGTSDRLKAMWRATQHLKVRSGPFFKISKKTMLYSLNIMLNNLATLFLIRKCWECAIVL